MSTPSRTRCQYALQKTGQSVINTAGTLTIPSGKVDADVDAVEAWSVNTGSAIKAAVLDFCVANDNADITPKVVAGANFSSGETKPRSQLGGLRSTRSQCLLNIPEPHGPRKR